MVIKAAAAEQSKAVTIAKFDYVTNEREVLWFNS